MHRFALFPVSFFWVFPAFCLAQRSHDTTPALNSSNSMITVLDKKIDVEIRHALKRKKMVGLAVGILANGNTTFFGYGETKRGNGEIPNEHTIFEIGSITKTFTAIILASAVTEGKVNLNDPINKYLPDSIPSLGYNATAVTLVTLSNHSSGLPRLPSNIEASDEVDPYKNYDASDLYSFYKNFKLSRKPGEKMEYSNLGGATLGVILERVYRMRYDSLVVKMICDPLDMRDTRIVVPAGDLLRLAQGYASDGKAASAWAWKAFAGAGGLRSTTADMLKYAKANMDSAPPPLNKVIPLTHVTTFHINDNIGIGLGWIIYSSHHHKWFAHDGETGGFQSFLIVDPIKQTAVVVLSNKATDDDDAMYNLGTNLLLLVEKN
jgi:CubicO group peptidase (beta-lactamase class C family)